MVFAYIFKAFLDYQGEAPLFEYLLFEEFIHVFVVLLAFKKF